MRSEEHDEAAIFIFIVVDISFQIGSKKQFVEAGRRRRVEVRVWVRSGDQLETQPAEVSVAFRTPHLVTPVHLLHTIGTAHTPVTGTTAMWHASTTETLWTE